MDTGTKPRPRRRITDVPEPPRRHRGRVFARTFIFLLFLAAILGGSFYVFNNFRNTYEGKAILEIKAGVANACLDVHHNEDSTGSAVDVATCDGRPSQVWLATDSVVTHDNFCLTALGTPVSDNAKVVLMRCNGGAGQVWTSSYLDSFENPSSGQCLDVPNGQVGSQLIAGPCDDLTGPDETWLASRWSKDNTSSAIVSCKFASEGEQIGCIAAKQWITWNSGTSKDITL